MKEERELRQCPDIQINLKTATIIIGSLLLISSTAFFIWHLVVVLQWYDTPHEEYGASLLTWYKVVTVLEFFYIIINGLLLYGAKIENRYYVLPWIIITLLYTLLFVICIVTEPHKLVPTPLIFVIFGLGAMLIFTVIEFYLILVPRPVENINFFVSDRNINDVI